MSDSRWYFTEEQLANSPSRKCGINAEQELSYRQRAANLVQEMGQRLQVSQLCINTAIVYMHRFYAFHSFTLFHRNGIAAAAFFLAAKVEEQPRKLEHVIKILNICLEKNDNTRESYAEQAQELVFNENVLLQTLGFDVAIDHPHTHVVRACQLFNIVTVSRELRQTCYFMASNSLHLTTMCLKYRPTVVAAFCIYIACKWSRWEIPDSSEGKSWYSYVDENVTPDILKKLTDEYLQILERSPSKFKSKMKAITSNGQAGNTNPSVNRDDGPSHKVPHDKHHHHHRTSSSSANNVNSRKQEGVKQPIQQVPPGYKTQIGQRPPSSSSSSSSRPPYPGSESKPVNEDRTQHRQTMQESSTFTTLPRPIDAAHKQRSSSNQLPASSSSQPPMPHAKPTAQEGQRHSMSSSKPPIDYHQKSAKQPAASQLHPSQQQQLSHKKPSWPQQQQQPPTQQNPSKSSSSSSSQSHVQASHSQPNLSVSSATISNSRSSNAQSLPSYSESTKQQQSSSTQPNDFWFNDKLLEAPAKPISPLRQGKSMFSPSPEHEPAYDRTKMILMGAGAKRTESPKSEKPDRRSSTPSKREKRADMPTTPSSGQKSSSSSQKSNTVPPLIPDAQKKRPFSSMDDGLVSNEFNRESKSRKVDAVKSEPSLISSAPPMAKQPIETNPDIVKSLLQECYTTNKFDSFGMDSPLDVINTEPATLVVSNDSLIVPKMENGFEEDHHKRNKSKKKKDKHRKKKKSHKSDREDRKESSSSTSLKIILGKEKSDSKSSPESGLTGGLKIKIPIKDVNKTELPGVGGQSAALPPLPKLKISKDKIGSYNNNDGPSTSKKKDKDRSKSKSSKHGSSSTSGGSGGNSNNNNNSEFKDAGYQHQQMSVNKMNSQVPMQQQQQQQYHNMQMGTPFETYAGGNNFQQQGLYQQHQSNQLQHQPTMMNPQHNNFPFNDYYHMNNTTQPSFSNGNGSKN